MLDSSIKLDKLHLVLQLAMGWSGGHLHAFVHHDEVYAEPDPDFNDYLDETKLKLSTLLKEEKQKLRYDYDFGDGWEHDVLLEKILPFTGGIGENDAWLRQHCCAGLEALGISVDTQKNQHPEQACGLVSSDQGRVKVLVIRTREELEIALQTEECLRLQAV